MKFGIVSPDAEADKIVFGIVSPDAEVDKMVLGIVPPNEEVDKMVCGIVLSAKPAPTTNVCRISSFAVGNGTSEFLTLPHLVWVKAARNLDRHLRLGRTKGFETDGCNT